MKRILLLHDFDSVRDTRINNRNIGSTRGVFPDLLHTAIKERAGEREIGFSAYSYEHPYQMWLAVRYYQAIIADTDNIKGPEIRTLKREIEQKCQGVPLLLIGDTYRHALRSEFLEKSAGVVAIAQRAVEMVYPARTHAL